MADVATLIKKTIKKHFFGRRRYQALWERLHAWSLEGMNIGHWVSMVDPVELWVLRHVGRYIAQRQSTNGSDAEVVIFDVGANTGLYSLEALHQLGDKIRLFSFEPARQTYDLLKQTLSGYKNVCCINSGLSDVEKTATLYSVAADPCLASVYDRFRFNDGAICSPDSRSSESVRLQTLDSFCDDQGITKIDLLKVDVEGHELDVLRGARTLIGNRAINFIQFEFGGIDIDSKTFLHDFFELLGPNFKIYRILVDGIVEIGPYHEKNEIFLYANYLAVLQDGNHQR